MVLWHPFRTPQQPSAGPHSTCAGRELRIRYRYRLGCRSPV
jgi:hypothetical protein